MSLEYKVQLALPGEEEIRFIQITKLCQYDYNYLRHRIAISFPILNQQDFCVYWIDEEGDKIRINSNDDLTVMVNRRVFSSVKKLYVTLNGPRGNLNTNATVDQVMNILFKDISRPIHTGVNCDGCQQNPLQGYRYKCLVCPDYDLCINCEKSGNFHSHHPMVRLSAPLNSKLVWSS